MAILLSSEHMQEALRQMNLLLDNVVTDITGKTGMAIINAILEGERNPVKLASLRDGRCKNDEKTIASSLEGHYRSEYFFSLQQAFEIGHPTMESNFFNPKLAYINVSSFTKF